MTQFRRILWWSRWLFSFWRVRLRFRFTSTIAGFLSIVLDTGALAGTADSAVLLSPRAMIGPVLAM